MPSRSTNAPWPPCATRRRPTFIFVLHPEAIAIKETQRAIGELGKLDIHTHRLIVNGIIPPEERANPLFAARAEMQARYLAQIERELPYPTQRMSLLAGEIKGVATAASGRENLLRWQAGQAESDAASRKILRKQVIRFSARQVVRARFCRTATAGRSSSPARAASARRSPRASRPSGWRGRAIKTLLLTTDPAAHLGDVLGAAGGR